MKYFVTVILFLGLLMGQFRAFGQDKGKLADSLLTFAENWEILDSTFSISYNANEAPYTIGIYQLDLTNRKKAYVVCITIGLLPNFEGVFVLEKVNNKWLKRRLTMANEDFGGVSEVLRKDINFDGTIDLVFRTMHFRIHGGGSVLFFLNDPQKQTIVHNSTCAIPQHRDTIVYKQEKKQILNEYGGSFGRARQLYTWRTPFDLVLSEEIIFSKVSDQEFEIKEVEHLSKREVIEKVRKMPENQALVYFEKWGL